MQFVIHLSVGGLGKNKQLPVMWGLNFTVTVTVPRFKDHCIGEITFSWRCSRTLPNALSLQPRSHAHVLSLNAAYPGLGLRNLPSPSQPDFIWSVEKHVILCSGVQSCLLDENHDCSTGLFPCSSRLILPPWAGWSRQSHGGRVWWVGSRQGKGSCWKEQCCCGWQPLVGSFPSILVLLLWDFCYGFGQEWASSPHPCCRLLEKHDHSAVCLAALAALSYHIGCSVAILCVHFMWGGRIQVPGCSEQPGWEVSLILLCPLKPRDWSSVMCGQLLSLSAAAVVW